MAKNKSKNRKVNQSPKNEENYKKSNQFKDTKKVKEGQKVFENEHFQIQMYSSGSENEDEPQSSDESTD